MRKFLTSINLARLALLAVLAFSLYQLGEMKHPSKSAWAKHIAEGKEPTVGEHVQVGLWYGAAARVGITGILLVVSLAWPLVRPAPEGGAFDLHGTPVSPRNFWLTIGGITLVALAMRLPRMSHSFWGDESDAVASYVHGQFRPLKKKDPQGALYFEQPSWGQTFFSARHGPNNHVLFSLASRACLVAWQDFTDRKITDFAEWPIRMPSLLAGLGSLVALACLLRRWGAPGLGLCAAAFMALHPWHVRYSTEARGYALALCLLPLALIVLTNALARRGWWHWLAFGLLEFLLMYSWPGIAYPLTFINLAVFVIMLLRSDRWMLLVRWGTAHLLAAAAFLSLYLPHVPQIKRYTEKFMWVKGYPMDDIWLHNILASPFTGIGYHGPITESSGVVSWQSLIHSSPILTLAGFSLIILATFVGLICLWRRDRKVACIVASVFLAAVVSCFHFKAMETELRAWYLVFTLPFLAISVAAALSALKGAAARSRPLQHARMGLTVAVCVVMLAAIWPMNRMLMAHAAEDYKGVMELTRQKHEIFYPKGRAEIFTCWLWRFAALYDPRGEIHVRNAPSLLQRMEEAKAANGPLFIIVGNRGLAEGINGDMIKVLDDPTKFDKVASFPAYDPTHLLDIYQMKPVE